jgi:hypothetical protein
MNRFIGAYSAKADPAAPTSGNLFAPPAETLVLHSPLGESMSA